MNVEREDPHSDRAQQKLYANLSKKYATVKYKIMHILFTTSGIGNISGYLEVRVN